MSRRRAGMSVDERLAADQLALDLVAVSDLIEIYGTGKPISMNSAGPHGC